MSIGGVLMPLAIAQADEEDSSSRIGSASAFVDTTATDGEAGYTVEPAGAPPLEAGYTVETFQHPGAGRIAMEYNILLTEGDGNIIQDSCNGVKEQIIVESYTGDWDRTSWPKICFTLTGDTGWLRLEIPSSYAVRASKNHALTVTTRDDIKTDTVTVSADKYKNINTSIDETGVAVIELRVK
ncbi:MAG: hypothetical protein ACTHMF_04175 [Leifsonia sp.]|uniref:hypothetical protein n=1 Tax=Leifsonia sp. TaxID=1870902 RepID=UPI003F7FFAA3